MCLWAYADSKGPDQPALHICAVWSGPSLTANRITWYYKRYEWRAITKTYLCNFHPLKPHFYIVKLGFTGVYIIFLISAQKYRLWVLGYAVLTGTHNLCFEQKYEKYQNFLSENFQFLVVKFSVYLNRCVFVVKFMFWAEIWKISEFFMWKLSVSDGEIFNIFNPSLAEHMPSLSKQCRSRSVGFWRSQLILICTVCH